MRTYRGYRRYQVSADGSAVSAEAHVTVEVNGIIRPLPPRLDIRNHSPTGFEWGYQGSGPAQLALALVADACGDDYATPEIYQRFKQNVVALLKHDGWELDRLDVQSAVDNLCDEIDPERIPLVYPADEDELREGGEQ